MTGDQSFFVSYIPLPRLWCKRQRCEWSRELPSLDRVTVERIKGEHVAMSHSSDVGASGP